jgi:aryl-alcohol dehydrogenase-like predicted oxidoreductase
MQTDRIDLLYLHSLTLDADGSYVTPLEETWGAMDDLVTQGKVNYLGVSNHTAKQVEDVQRTLKEVGKDTSRRVVAVENRYNMAERKAVTKEEAGNEQDFLKACDALGVSIVPYFPLASGLLTGRYRKRTLKKASGRIIDDGAQGTFLTKRNLDIVEALLPIAEGKGVSLAQLAIAWLLAKPQVASVIAGVTRMDQLEDNAKAHQVALSEEDMKRIEAVLEAPKPVRTRKAK